ncbi:MAG: polysaccharide deacetylase family protein [bacterium]|nr:polysaccharide deacetylase family protein [bacterium]
MAHSDRVTQSGVEHAAPAVLVFHKLQASFSFGATNYSPKRFAKLLHRLNSNGTRFTVTFDDGYQHLANNLPALMDRYQFHPTIFVPTGWIGKPNSWDYSHWFRREPHLERREIRELANIGVIFGSHGHSHVDLTAASERKLKMELRQSREILSDLAAREITAISYPFGRHNEMVLEAAEWAGYTAGYTMTLPMSSDHVLSQGRIPVYGYDTMLTIRNKMGQGVWHRIEALKVSITNQLSGGTILLNRMRRLD